MPILEIIAALLFIVSSGLLFTDRFRNNKLVVGLTAIVAIISTTTLALSIIPEGNKNNSVENPVETVSNESVDNPDNASQFDNSSEMVKSSSAVPVAISAVLQGPMEWLPGRWRPIHYSTRSPAGSASDDFKIPCGEKDYYYSISDDKKNIIFRDLGWGGNDIKNYPIVEIHGNKITLSDEASHGKRTYEFFDKDHFLSIWEGKDSRVEVNFKRC